MTTQLQAREAPSPERVAGATAWLSWLKVVAIVGVISIHTAGFTAVIDGAREKRHGQLGILLDAGFLFAVPVFVLVSGALLLDPRRFTGTKEFLRRRAWRLVPALVFWHLFYWGFRAVKGNPLPWRTALAWTLNGKLSTGLYFFWIVLGLAVVAPLLIRWLASADRAAVIAVGVAAAAMPVLSSATAEVRGVDLITVETPWTWWVFYVGYFLLGWGLRGVVLQRWALAATSVATAALAVLVVWQWHNAAAPGWLHALAPVSYYGLTVHLYAIGLFLLGQAVIRPDGVLRILAGDRLARLGRVLADATLGVFAVHIAVLNLVWRLPLVGGEPAVASSLHLVARVAAVVVLSYAVVLPLRRVPVVRRVI